jgi:glutaredoxin
MDCPWCAEARAILDRQGIDYDERDVTTDSAAAAEMRRLSGQNQTPVVSWADEIFTDTGAAEFESFLAAMVFSGKVRL